MNEEERRLRRSSEEVRVNPDDPVKEMETSGGGHYRIDLDIDESRELTEAQKHAILNILVSNSNHDKTRHDQRGTAAKEDRGEPSKNRHEYRKDKVSSDHQRLAKPSEEDFLDQDLSKNTQTVVVFVTGVVVGVLLLLLRANIS